MKSCPPIFRKGADPRLLRRLRAFTLAEVLAALVLMAIVIPVAIEGTAVASRAGQLGARKAAAARVAQRILDETIVTGATLEASTSGTVEEDHVAYAWTLTSEPWSVDDLDLVTVRVAFTVQGRDYDVALSTLLDPTASAATSSTALF